jgi:hypothetical protein
MSSDRKRVIHTKTATLTLIEEAVVSVVIKAKAEVSLVDAMANHEATVALIGDQPHVVLVDPRLARGIVREARNYLSAPETRKYTRAQAILVGSALSRVMGSFFLGLNRGKFPCRLFTSEEQAREWLEGFLP